MSDSANDKVKKVVDDVAGSGTSDKIEGKATAAIGSAQRTLGDMNDDPEMENAGADNEAKGKAQEAMGDVKGAMEHAVEGVKDAAGHAADAVKGLFDRKEKID